MVGNGKKALHGAGHDLSGDSIVQKLNVTDVQASASQTKGRGNSTFTGSTYSDPGQILSHNSPQVPITEQSLTYAENAKTANLPGQSASTDVSADVGKQILESIHNSLSQQGPDRQITVRLNPPELGKVLIKFQAQDAQIAGILEVSKTQTRLEIEQALPQIVRNLTDCGIAIKRIEVVLSDGEQSGQQTFKDPLLQDGFFGHHSSGNPNSSGDNPGTTGTNEWLTNDGSYQNTAELQEMLVAEDSINVLV